MEGRILSNDFVATAPVELELPGNSFPNEGFVPLDASLKFCCFSLIFSRAFFLLASIFFFCSSLSLIALVSLSDEPGVLESGLVILFVI